MSSMKALEFSHASFQGRIGIARTDITPPVGIYARNWGAATRDVADAIHRPLSLTALTLSTLEAGHPQILVDADLGWWQNPETFYNFQAQLLDELSLDPANLIFALSHTHSGPPLTEVDDSLPGSALHHTWMKNLVTATITTIRQALDTPFDGIVDWHHGRCGLATVRDLPDPDPKKERIISGYHPDGTPDDTLLLGRITDSSGQVRATLVNYACHPTTLAWENSAISPDYVGAMRESIQESTGAPALFLLGACGDLAPRHQYVEDTGIADQHGRQLGFAALATLQGMEPAGTRLTFAETVESGAPLAVWNHERIESSNVLRTSLSSVELTLKNWPSVEELERLRQACDDRALAERLRRKRDIRRGLGDGTTYKLPLFVWRIGNAVLVGCCCEPYSILQLELRRQFPDLTIICMNLINGSLGYLPAADLYDQDIYPVWQTPFERGSLERVLKAMTQSIRDVLAN
jgi:hypothetical protein